MSKTYFVSSDIHGFFTEYITSLLKKGFDFDNPEHVVVICGDIFDRGSEPLEIYDFLKNLPKERKILIRGNHEHLLRDLVNRGYEEHHDVSNKTMDTLCYIAGYDHGYDMFKITQWSEIDDVSKIIKEKYPDRENGKFVWPDDRPEMIALNEKHKKEHHNLFTNDKIKEIIDWIYSDEWCNYYETKNYIFVHGFIPYNQDWNIEYGIPYPVGPKRYREDWRNATDTEWEDASWFNWRESIDDIKNGLNSTNKTIVVGHWHTSDIYNRMRVHKESNSKPITDNPIYKSKRYKIVALDTCTVVTKKVNVLKLTEEEI